MADQFSRAAAYRRAQPARSERDSSAEAEAAQAEQGPMRAEEGAVCAKELSLQLGRLLEVSNPFVHSRGSSSDGSSESAASSSPVSTARSAKSDGGDDGSTSGSFIQRRKAVSAAVAGADGGVRKKEAGGGDRSRQRRRRKSGSRKKGKSKAEMCPCGCARLVPADALAEQQREVKLQTTPCQRVNPPTNARLFGQRSATPTCPIESPFLDSLVRSLAFEASNDDVKANPPVAEAGKSPGVECVASDCFRDNCGRCNARDDAAGDTNESGNCTEFGCKSAAATESSLAVFQQKVDLRPSENERQTAEEHQAGSDCNGKRRDKNQRRNEDETMSQLGSLRLETPTKPRHFDRSMAVARWILSPVNPYSSTKRRSSSHDRTLEDTRSSSSARSEPATRPSSRRTKSVSARRDLSGSFGGAVSQPTDVRVVVSEPASLFHSARTDASTTKSSHNQTSTSTSSGGVNKDNSDDATSDVKNTHRVDWRGHSKPPMWRWLHLLSSNMESQHPHTSQPRLVS